ncbi:MAG: FKBP-type peptidyl-prolyl cis-trans isomerase, partial [Actinomycetota bacterium]
MPTARTRARLLALPVALLVACAGNDPVVTGAPPTNADGDGGTAAPTSPAATAPSPTGELATKPVVVVPDGPPPTELKVRDIVEGTGPEAKPGQTVSVQYVGVSYSTKKQFDSSWDRGARPIDFPIGVGYVIKGWD